MIVHTPPIEVKEFFQQRRTIQAFYEQYGGLTIYRSVNKKNDKDELLYLVSPSKGLRPMLKKRSACKSPYLARVLEIGTIPETTHPYWVCALDLASKFDELLNEQYRAERICRLLQQVGVGLSVLHSNHVYHGDVRAGNVWVRLRESEEEAFLVGVSIDQWAGVISSTSPTLEQSRYMAPERTMGEKSSKSSDIYSFAILVYRSLSGSYPFDGTEAFSISASHATEPVPVPIPPFDEPLWKILQQCLAKDPSARPLSLEKIIGLLGEYADGLRAPQQAEPKHFSSDEEVTPLGLHTSVDVVLTDSPIEVSIGSQDFSLSDDSHSLPPTREKPEANPLVAAEASYDSKDLLSAQEEQFSLEPSIVIPEPSDKTDWAQKPIVKPTHESSHVSEAKEEVRSVEELVPIEENVLDSEKTHTEIADSMDDLDSETMYNVVSNGVSVMSEVVSEVFTESEMDVETMDYTEGSEDITIVPARVQLPLVGKQDDMRVPQINVISPKKQAPEPPKIDLDVLAPMAKADITENEEDDEVIDMTTSIEMDVKKYLLIFILCFVITILFMLLIS